MARGTVYRWRDKGDREVAAALEKQPVLDSMTRVEAVEAVGADQEAPESEIVVAARTALLEILTAGRGDEAGEVEARDVLKAIEHANKFYRSARRATKKAPKVDKSLSAEDAAKRFRVVS